MGKMRKWLNLVFALWVTVAGVVPVRAADVGEGTKAGPGGRTGQQIIVVDPADSTRYLLKGTEDGGFLTTDASRDRDWFIKHNNLLQTTLLGGNRDSSQAMPTLGATRSWLRCYGLVDSLVHRCVVALEVRGHYVQQSDSLSTVKFDWGRNSSYIDSVGTANLNVSYAMLSATLLPNEVAVVIPSLTAQPRPFMIPLENRRTGSPFVAPFISIKVRPVAFYDASGAVITLTSRRVNLTFDYVGMR